MTNKKEKYLGKISDSELDKISGGAPIHEGPRVEARAEPRRRFRLFGGGKKAHGAAPKAAEAPHLSGPREEARRGPPPETHADGFERPQRSLSGIQREIAGMKAEGLAMHDALHAEDRNAAELQDLQRDIASLADDPGVDDPNFFPTELRGAESPQSAGERAPVQERAPAETAREKSPGVLSRLKSGASSAWEGLKSGASSAWEGTQKAMSYVAGLPGRALRRLFSGGSKTSKVRETEASGAAEAPQAGPQVEGQLADHYKTIADVFARKGDGRAIGVEKANYVNEAKPLTEAYRDQTSLTGGDADGVASAMDLLISDKGLQAKLGNASKRYARAQLVYEARQNGHTDLSPEGLTAYYNANKDFINGKIANQMNVRAVEYNPMTDGANRDVGTIYSPKPEDVEGWLTKA